MTEMTVEEFKALRERGEPHLLLDVRDPSEIERAALPGATSIPMMEIPLHVDELPRDVPIIVMCHSGARSAYVTEILEDEGLKNAVNLAGGIEAWAERIDPTVMDAACCGTEGGCGCDEP